MSHNKKIQFSSSLRGLIELRSTMSLDNTSAISLNLQDSFPRYKDSQPRSCRRSQSTAHNVSGIRPSPHSIFDVSRCSVVFVTFTSFPARSRSHHIRTHQARHCCWVTAKNEGSSPSASGSSGLQKSCATRAGSQSSNGTIAARAGKLMRAEMISFAVDSVGACP